MGLGRRCCASPSARSSARTAGVDQPWTPACPAPTPRGRAGWEEALRPAPRGAGSPAEAQRLPKCPLSSAGLSFPDPSLPVGLDRPGHSPLPHTFGTWCLGPRRGLAGSRQAGLRAPLSSLHLTAAPPPTASSAAVGSGAPPEAEQAWPQSSGEEELQLQLALAMSKEEADQVPGPGRLGWARQGLTFVLPSHLHASPQPSARRLPQRPARPRSVSAPWPCRLPLCRAVLGLPLPSPPPDAGPVRLCYPSPVRGLFLCLRLCLSLALYRSVCVSVSVPPSLSPLACHPPPRPLTRSLPQPPSCGPEDDVQLQLALSLSREEHDKVRADSPPCRLPGTLPQVPPP